MNWQKELEILMNNYIESSEEIDFSEYADRHASPEFLEMSNKEHARLEELHTKGIYE